MTTMRAFKSTTSMLALCLAAMSFAPAQAQPATEQPPADQSNETSDSAPVEKVVVTGSRIPRPNLEQPTPVTTVTNDRIRESGTSNLGDIVAQFPALSSNGTVRANSDSFGDSGGLNFPDLRSLGTGRTLTLVNGKRHVAGDAGDQAVDFNSIPPALVERIEVVTGGASAIYGSDAVTGVINVILKDDFEGFEANVQGAWPTEGGYGLNFSANASGGFNFNDDRGNFVVSVFYDKTDPVTASDIKVLNEYGSVNNPADTGTNDGITDTFLVPRVVSEFIDENGVLIPFDHFLFGGPGTTMYGFSNSGVPVVQPNHGLENSIFFGVVENCATCFEVEDWILFIPDTERKGASVNFRYDLRPDLRFYVDAKYVTTDIADYVQPSFSFGDYVIDFTTNPFVDPALAAQIIADTGVPAALLTRFNGDVGGRETNVTRTTKRLVAGFEGDVDLTGVADIDWEVSYNRGVTKNKIVSNNTLLPGNYEAALDAVVDPGDLLIKCRKDVPALQFPGYVDPSVTSEACVPFNPFGQQNSAAAIDYVSYDGALRRHTITQDVFQAVFNFDTGEFVSLQGGPIAFAGGFEYRKESSENLNDPVIQSGITETAPQPDAFGGFNVKEAFIEFSVPLLEESALGYRLTLDAAYRYADYSHAGIARAWKAGGIYAPVKDLSFRGTYSRAVRAPNITEAFLPPTSAFFDYSDPCDDAAINDDPDRAANCAALGAPPGFDAQDNIGVPISASGNPDLDPETAETWTLGAVFQPRWVKNLSLTVDYYSIEIEDAIAFIDPQAILDNCVDSSGSPDPSFCSLQTRDPATFDVTFIESTYVNASALTTKGVDIQLAYAFDVDDVLGDVDPFFTELGGRIALTVVANYVEELRFFAFQSDPTDENIEEGEAGDPEWSFITNATYDNGPIRVTWRSRYEDQVSRFAQGSGSAEDVFPSYVEAVWYHDFVFIYRLEQLTGHESEMYIGVNNAFDEELPLGLTGNGTSSAYDLLGRTVFVGARAKF
ncbi:MAG: TonB-dependent receptor [Alphaproteobacteria bacterium]|nr:TonB-dependent receptor [Alphaproteobacteria bacterium]